MFSPDGSKAAWLELAEDGYESDAAKIVVYDLRVDVRYMFDFKSPNAQEAEAAKSRGWDRSPGDIIVRFVFDGSLAL